MSLRDPVVAYTAGNNVEAHMICEALHNAGIEAHLMEDVSQVGVGWLGNLPGIHKPQVWVERADLDEVRPILAEFERRTKASAESKLAKRGSLGTIAVVCEECGKSAEFPIEQEGSVQDCPHCGEYIDVEEPGEEEDWGEVEEDETQDRDGHDHQQ